MHPSGLSASGPFNVSNIPSSSDTQTKKVMDQAIQSLPYVVGTTTIATLIEVCCPQYLRPFLVTTAVGGGVLYLISNLASRNLDQKKPSPTANPTVDLEITDCGKVLEGTVGKTFKPLLKSLKATINDKEREKAEIHLNHKLFRPLVSGSTTPICKLMHSSEDYIRANKEGWGGFFSFFEEVNAEAIMANLCLEPKTLDGNKPISPFFFCQEKPLNYLNHVEKKIPFPSDLGTKIKHKPADPITDFLSGGTDARLINLALGLEEYLAQDVVDRISTLKQSIDNSPQSENQREVNCYKALSPLDVLMMEKQGQFYIPEFLQGYSEKLDLTNPECPVKLYTNNKNSDFNTVNALLKIKVDPAVNFASAADQKCLLPCYTQYKFIKKIENESGMMVIELEAVQDNPFEPRYMNEAHERWWRKRGEATFGWSTHEGLTYFTRPLNESWDRNKFDFLSTPSNTSNS